MLIDLFLLVVTLVMGYLLYLRLGRRTGTEKSPFFYSRRFSFSPQTQEAVVKVADVPFIKPITQIQQIDKTFSQEGFLNFAKVAFEQIVTTYVKGNIDDLKKLLTEGMYTLYQQEKKALIDKKIVSDLLFFRLISAKIKDIKIEKSMAQIQIWFVSEQTQVLKNSKGKTIEGDENAIDRISELWTFQKLITRKNEDWVLSAIGAHAEA